MTENRTKECAFQFLEGTNFELPGILAWLFLIVFCVAVVEYYIRILLEQNYLVPRKYIVSLTLQIILIILKKLNTLVKTALQLSAFKN